MPLIIWHDRAGAEARADVALGARLMESAPAAGVPGIHDDCGGTLACADRHIVPEPPLVSAGPVVKVPQP